MGFEKVYRLEEGKYKFHKFAARLPETFLRYHTDPETEDLKTIDQWVCKNGSWQTIPLDANDLMLFVNNMEGANYKGWSILSAAWPHWHIKQKYYVAHAIAIDRWSTGVPVMKQTQGGAFDEDKAVDILSEMRSHEKLYLVEPLGYEFRIEGLTGTLPDPTEMIVHHNKQISKATLASFIDMGVDKIGTQAAIVGHKDVFFLATQAVVNQFLSVLNPEIRRLCDLNWNLKDYPELKVDNLQAKDLQKTALYLNLLAKSGYVKGGLEIEEWVREIFDAPDIPDERIEAGNATANTSRNTRLFETIGGTA
jgi:hypothetical protein